MVLLKGGASHRCPKKRQYRTSMRWKSSHRCPSLINGAPVHSELIYLAVVRCPLGRCLPSQVPQLTWMSVGRTNALRAGNLTSEASSTEKMDCTPPHDTHHWLLHHVYKPWTLSQLAQVISGRSCSTFRCASSLSTFLEHLFQQDFFQFKVVFAARDGFIFVKPFSNWISHNLHLYLRQWILPCFHTVF